MIGREGFHVSKGPGRIVVSKQPGRVIQSSRLT